MHRNLRYYETSAVALFFRKALTPADDYKTNKMVTLNNSILKYIGMKYINILKRKCLVGITVAFLELILKLYDVCFMKNFFIAP